MGNLSKVTLLVFVIFVEFITCQLSKNKDELLNWCLNSKTHKHKPGKEDDLHNQCTPWKNHACCTSNVTVDIHEINMYNFTFDHCYDETGRNMSEACRKHFIQDNCFYHCEPHIGMWVVKTTRKIASERFLKVPLCADDCDKWFEDCKDDLTCAYNWPRDFVFKKGHNKCPKESTCITFEKMYHTADKFCENVWDESWKYTTRDKPCMSIWFNSTENPNEEVALYYIKQYLGSATTYSMNVWLLLTAFLILSLNVHF